MSIAETIEFSAESTEGFEQAIEDGVSAAKQSLGAIESVWVKQREVRRSEDGRHRSYRVWLKATFVTG